MKAVRILVVDDDEDDFVMTRDTIQDVPDKDFAIDWASTYDAGLAEIKRGVHDIYFVDYNLGQHTGLDVLIEAIAAGCRAPIVLLTGLDDRDVDLAASKAGAFDYLIKSQVDPSRIERTIRYSIERKRAEAERTRIEDQLQQAQKLESIGRLAAGIAHEINTPTQFIGDNIQFLRESFGEISPILTSMSEALDSANGELSADSVAGIKAAIADADLDFLLEEIPASIDQSLEGVDRVASIVRAMKEFSHPGSSTKEPTDVNRAITNTIAVSRNEWKYCAELVTDLDPNLPTVQLHAGDFNQAVLNIIVNAAHAVLAANGDSTAPGKITVTTRLVDGFAELAIRDTGGGIPADIQDKIFDPFFTTKDVGKGTGQGLAIAYSAIVDKNGGTVDFETEAGVGTTFYIRIPIEDELEASASTGEPELLAKIRP